MTTVRRFAATDATTPGKTSSDLAKCLRAIRSEYRDLPGLALTRPQVTKLWNLAPAFADALLSDLITAGFLRCNATGRYVRANGR